ncbi:MAG: hypothetical protein WBB94_00240 [Candidatus Saccharimonadaceae bacterium]
MQIAEIASQEDFAVDAVLSSGFTEQIDIQVKLIGWTVEMKLH